MKIQSAAWALGLVAAMTFASCTGERPAAKGQPVGDGVEPDPCIIAIDGSSTVYPISEAVAEDFQKTNETRVTIAIGGTGGGFQKFCAGEAAISNASRPIKPVEIEACKRNGVEFLELPIAYDGIVVVVNPRNDWVKEMKVEELAKLWSPDAQGKLTRWSQVRAGWPDREIHLFGPGVDSGTFDYFTAATVGKERASRGDYTSSEDDNVLVQGIAADSLALGYFGRAYFEGNRDKLRVVPIDDGKAENGDGPMEPTIETVTNGTYQPLSRPLFVYVSRRAAERREVREFVDFYLANAARLAPDAGYIALPPFAYELAKARFAAMKTGSVFEGGLRVGMTVEQLLASERQ